MMAHRVLWIILPSFVWEFFVFASTLCFTVSCSLSPHLPQDLQITNHCYSSVLNNTSVRLRSTTTLTLTPTVWPNSDVLVTSHPLPVHDSRPENAMLDPIYEINSKGHFLLRAISIMALTTRSSSESLNSAEAVSASIASLPRSPTN